MELGGGLQILELGGGVSKAWNYGGGSPVFGFFLYNEQIKLVEFLITLCQSVYFQQLRYIASSETYGLRASTTEPGAT